ncbi:MAG: lipopolysaccharide kinase InaA family protein [Flavobacterium sp.]
MNNFKINSNFNTIKELILEHILQFNSSGKYFVQGQRNAIKLFEIDGITLNIKSFKKPNLVNKIAYRYFRKSKARRSFEYASKLMDLGIGTPSPIAYLDNFDFIGLNDSYYVCEHLEDVFEFRALVQNEDFNKRECIIRQFVEFSYLMHQKGVEFLDHSPGNTLIKDNNDGTYSFYLVDLNRMKFHESIDFQTRMKNLSHLTPQKEMIVIMANEYAKLSGENEQNIFETLWKYTSDFQFCYHRKKRIKKKLKFWKK